MAPPDQRTRATVVGYDPAADAYECNHTLGWSAAGAMARLVSAAELELDRTFTTKDACEELVKPLVVPYALSVVGLLQRAAADPAVRAALSDPAQAGLVAPGLRRLFASPAGASIAMALVALASVFDSHAWSYPFAAVVSALELFEAGQPAGTRHSHWFDIFTVCQDPAGQAAFPADYFYTTFKDGECCRSLPFRSLPLAR